MLNIFSQFATGRTRIFFLRYIHTVNKNTLVLGIETSCDDTGVGLVNGEGIILGNSLSSQQELHLK